MSQQEKVNQKIDTLVEDLFNSTDKELKIDAVSASFVIMYQFKGNAKFMQNMLCPTPHVVNNKMKKQKAIVDQSLMSEIENIDSVVKLQDLNKNKIKKQYSIAVVDPKKLDKGYRGTLTRKALLDAKIDNKDELLNLYKQIQEDKCTKIIQTNNTLSCKLGNLSQGREEIKANLHKVIQFLNSKNLIIKTVSLLLHQQDGIKVNIHRIK